MFSKNEANINSGISIVMGTHNIFPTWIVSYVGYSC